MRGERRAVVVLEDRHELDVDPEVPVAVHLAEPPLDDEPVALVQHPRARVDLEHVEPDAVQAQAVGLSASALSQHLGRLRAENLVAFRRDGQSIFYRLEDARTVHVIGVLKGLFCPPGR